MPISSIFACFRKFSTVVSFAETGEKLGHETESKLGSDSCMEKAILFKSHKSLVVDKYDKKSAVESSSSSMLSGSSARHSKVQNSVPEDAGPEEIQQMGVVLVNKRSSKENREEMVVVPPEVNLWKRRTTGQPPQLQLETR